MARNCKSLSQLRREAAWRPLPQVLSREFQQELFEASEEAKQREQRKQERKSRARKYQQSSPKQSSSFSSCAWCGHPDLDKAIHEEYHTAFEMYQELQANFEDHVLKYSERFLDQDPFVARSKMENILESYNQRMMFLSPQSQLFLQKERQLEEQQTSRLSNSFDSPKPEFLQWVSGDCSFCCMCMQPLSIKFDSDGFACYEPGTQLLNQHERTLCCKTCEENYQQHKNHPW